MGGASDKTAAMLAVFPDALTSLRDTDKEIWDLVQAEKARQWCVRFASDPTTAPTLARSAPAARASSSSRPKTSRRPR